MYKYIKLSPNFHLFINPSPHFRTEMNLTFSSGGAFFEKEEEKGLTHLLEHCEVQRTKALSKKELSKLLFEKDLYRNASTGILMKDITLSGHRDYIDTMLELILQFGFEPEITQEILDIEKQIVLRELAQRKGDPSYKLGRMVLESIYKANSKELVDIAGNEEIIANATIDQLQKIHKRVLENSHFLLSIVGGGIDIEKIEKLAKKYSKNLPSDKTHPIDQTGENFIQDFKYKPIVSELAHEHCILSMSVPVQTNFGNRSIRDILAEILFFYPEGILYKTLRDELQLVYSVDYTFDESLEMLRINMVGEIGNAQKLIDETIKILKTPEDYINEDKLKIIKNLYVKRQELSSDNPTTSTEFVTNTLLNYGVEQNYEDYLKELKEVKFEDIINYSSEIRVNLKDMRVVVVSKDKEIEKLELKY